jgi:hypothetical protein
MHVPSTILTLHGKVHKAQLCFNNQKLRVRTKRSSVAYTNTCNWFQRSLYLVSSHILSVQSYFMPEHVGFTEIWIPWKISLLYIIIWFIFALFGHTSYLFAEAGNYTFVSGILRFGVKVCQLTHFWTFSVRVSEMPGPSLFPAMLSAGAGINTMCVQALAAKTSGTWLKTKTYCM